MGELRVPSSPFARTFDKESSPFPPAMTSGRPPYIHFTHAYPVSNIRDSLPLIARQALPLIITISLLSLPRAPSTFSISLKLSTGPGISQGVHIPDEEHRKYSLPVTWRSSFCHPIFCACAAWRETGVCLGDTRIGYVFILRRSEFMSLYSRWKQTYVFVLQQHSSGFCFICRKNGLYLR